MTEKLLRPIIGIENRTAQEVFDMMCDRIRRTPAPEGEVVAWRWPRSDKPNGVDFTADITVARAVETTGKQVQPLYASPVVPVGREEAFPPPLFITSGGHLSGFRVCLGYETLAEASDAHSFLAALDTKGADHD